ncbi:hypothetical protein KQY30_03860 [Streptomyces sp. GMY02]|nr:hypothetical protein [Streptomyces sp. GMY02]QXE33553.1 hypothetical protein KQY30_03860 [Streptomyces sp. GMY02]
MTAASTPPPEATATAESATLLPDPWYSPEELVDILRVDRLRHTRQ